MSFALFYLAQALQTILFRPTTAQEDFDREGGEDLSLFVVMEQLVSKVCKSLGEQLCQHQQ